MLSHLDQLKDVLACTMTSRHMKSIAAYAPLRLHIIAEEFPDWSRPEQAGANRCEEARTLRQALKAVWSHFKGEVASQSFVK